MTLLLYAVERESEELVKLFTFLLTQKPETFRFHLSLFFFFSDELIRILRIP